ncbi:hypothetical protein SLA_6267 [Streptomyces laurentii]|uniref:Uncharacterized protein n=1 Tax=Streptomyces laurentii TaxID=39478 RepID=A0A160P7E1_STRLU|nr:hypothetical protein SLA_6267 [Streptomyces laurentii]
MRVIARRRRETTRWGYLPCPKGYGGARAGAREPSKIQKKGPSVRSSRRRTPHSSLLITVSRPSVTTVKP